MTQTPPKPNALDRKVATIGLSNHGKTVFLSSLFYDSFYTLAHNFDGFTINPTNETAIQMFYDNAQTLHDRRLPRKTPVRTPEPATLEFKNVPYIPRAVRIAPALTRIASFSADIRLTFYDIAGEPFQSVNTVKQYAKYIEEADDLIFLFDPSDPEFNALVGARLIDTVVSCYNQSLQKNVIIVVSKMDELREAGDFASDIQPLWPDKAPVWPPHYQTDLETVSLTDYLDDMKDLSNNLRDHWWRSHRQGASALINKLNKNSTHYCAVSSVGRSPVNDAQTGEIRLESLPEPFRVRDPLFWIFKAAGVFYV